MVGCVEQLLYTLDRASNNNDMTDSFHGCSSTDAIPESESFCLSRCDIDSSMFWIEDKSFALLKGEKGIISLVWAKYVVLGPNHMLKSLWGWIKNKGIKKWI